MVPLQFDGNLPYINASSKMQNGNEISGTFVIDLGSEISVMVRQDYAAKHDLLKSLCPTIEVRVNTISREQMQ